MVGTLIRLGGLGLRCGTPAPWHWADPPILLRASAHLARSEHPIRQPAVLHWIRFQRLPPWPGRLTRIRWAGFCGGGTFGPSSRHALRHGADRL